jgi:iron-sulfur cluster repair protein YtfE (RIC family)
MLDMTINEIVAKFPETIPIFTQFGLDTCCGGGHKLGVAAAKHKIDEQQIFAALQTVVSP